jgi:type IV secretory system conjugative DNA transfer VirD4/TraG family protein
MDSQIFYRPSNQQTADYLEHCLGKKSNYAHSEVMREGVKESLGLSEQGVPLMPSQEIKQLGDEDIIGFHRHLPPLRLKRMDWRRFPSLTQRRSMPAPRLSFYHSLKTAYMRTHGRKQSSWHLRILTLIGSSPVDQFQKLPVIPKSSCYAGFMVFLQTIKPNILYTRNEDNHHHGI